MERENFSLKIRYNDKVKTFTNSIEINLFIGAGNREMEYRPVTPELYYIFNRHEFWDDDTEMTGEEWCKVTKALLLNCN